MSCCCSRIAEYSSQLQHNSTYVPFLVCFFILKGVEERQANIILAQPIYHILYIYHKLQFAVGNYVIGSFFYAFVGME